MSFNYSLHDKTSWPPMGRPKSPYGPTALEVMRSCMLRNCFEASPIYERRLGPAARIGTVLHRTLQSLNQKPIEAENTEQLAAETRRRFLAELQDQKDQSAARVREQSLVWDQNRTDHALEAVISEAIRTQPLGKARFSSSGWEGQSYTEKPTEEFQPSIENHNALVEVEVPVKSNNGLIQGRIDRVEKIENGVRLVDYKSAFREDLPERYIRQLQLYAYLWYETRGEWPIEALVFYPMLGTFHLVSVEKSICNQVAAESLDLIERVTKNIKPTDLGSPGDVCKVCEFRPWCHPFWNWQRHEANQLKAVDNASMGFEGQVQTIKLEKNYWYLHIEWHKVLVKLIAPQERFPHLVNAQAGQTVRLLDTNLKGQLFQPTANVNNLSEIFIVTN
jgi:CRISPR/Cas system-associated exonuclease Cas4 (RecB family)